ncbi:hypothetical protein G7046_g3417 [Stylonectria norvegica]|nr:hypothetical protein G7046_g3417 [Stylonectria norvegica]
MADSKQEISQVESSRSGTGVARRSKRNACARHCKRFWWLHLIIFILLAILAICIAIFVVVPKVAQSKVNAAKLEIQGVNVLETESNHFLMEINSTITTDGVIKADIDPFEGVMYLEDFEPHVPFVTLNFPKTNGNKHQIVNISQPIEITDMEAFTRFNVWFHNNETLRVTIKGRTKVQPKGLNRKSGVNFQKTVEMKGLNNFNGTEVTEGHISLEEDSNGHNFNGTANIPNASHFTLDIGNVSFINFVGDEKVGSLYIDNLLLVPGDNPVKISAFMDQVEILAIAAKRPYCETGIVPFKLLGDNVTNHNNNLTYFAAALASLNQTVSIDIGTIIKNDLKTTVKCRD